MNDAYLHHLSERDLRRASPLIGEIDEATERGIERMLRLMCDAGYPALAGPHVGLFRRILAVDLSGQGRSRIVLINPVVASRSREQQSDLEGCLCLPGLTARIRRPVQISVHARARTGHHVRLEAGGLLARILQHQIDHLNGVLLLDHLPPNDRSALTRRLRAQTPCCPLTGPERHGPRGPDDPSATR